jgi:enoyl-CoA hydratase
MQAIKKTVLDSHTLDWADAFALEMEQSAAVMMSQDAREGTRAFKEKRPAKFRAQ